MEPAVSTKAEVSELWLWHVLFTVECCKYIVLSET